MCALKVKVISLPYIYQVLYVLCISRPRYQVSVYMTIAPLVSILASNENMHYSLGEFGFLPHLTTGY